MNFDEEIESLGTESSNKDRINKWSNEKSQDFVNNIDMEAVNTIIQTFTLNYLDSDLISDAVHSLEKDLIKSATTTFGLCNSKNRKDTIPPNNKQWFNEDCKEARKEFHRCRRKYSFVKNDTNRADMLNSSKLYNES